MIKEFHESKNLFDEAYTGLTTSLTYLPMYVGDGEFTLSTTTPINDGTSASLFFLRGQASSGASTPTNGVWKEQSRTLTAINGYVTIAYRYNEGVYVNPQNYNTMLNKGSTALPYEPYGDTWNTKSYVKSITGTQTYTEFPIVLRTTEQSIPTWNVKGNEEHTGTPSPQNPVEVNGVGVRTANIFDSSKESKNTYISIYGNTGTSTVTNTSDYVKINSSTLVLSGIRTTALQNASERACCFYDASKTLIDGVLNPADISTPCIITVPQNTAYIRFAYDKSFEGAVMLNEGAVAIPYEPYGYKLDISNGQQTTNIYLGSTTLDKNGTAVDTIGNNTLYKATNRAVLTGSENWTLQSINQYGIANFYLANVLMGLDINEGILCSHGERQTTVISQTTTEGFLANNNGEIYFRINSTTASTVPEFQAWLSGQNPQVTFLYTLATPTSTTVTVPSIPTTSGLNTIDINTTLKPSEMSLTFDGYKLCKGQRYSRTENLWGGTTETNKYIDGQGNTGTASNGDIFDQKGINVASSTNYTFSWSNVVLGSEDNTPYIRICFYTSNGGTFISRILVTPSSYPDKYITFAIPSNCTYVDIRIDSETSTRGQHFVNLMLNVGSTAKPYQPYLDWE